MTDLPVVPHLDYGPRAMLDHLETYGTARLLRGWLRHCRAGVDQPVVTLADLRREVRLSQRELATRLGSSQARVARIQGSSSPSVRSLSRYLQALAMAPGALVVTSDRGGRIVRLTTPSEGGSRPPCPKA